MDIEDQLKTLHKRIENQKEAVVTEEGTKNAFVLPFLQILGYDVFNPEEVTPELTADVGTKKGEKVDFALKRDGEVTVIIECKVWKDSLDDKEHSTQLIRYFHCTSAKFAILTNGILYKFFTDQEQENKLDSIPFFEFDISDFNEDVLIELKKFHKKVFDVETIIATASDLKYTNAFRDILSAQIKDPSDDFVRLIANRIYSGRLTQRLVDQFTPLVQKSFQQIISDRVDSQLKRALKSNQEAEIETKPAIAVVAEEADPVLENQISEEELHTFLMLKVLLSEKVDPKRLEYKILKTFTSVFLDGYARKIICKLHYGSQQKYISFPSLGDKKLPLESIDEVVSFKPALHDSISKLLNQDEAVSPAEA